MYPLQRHSSCRDLASAILKCRRPYWKPPKMLAQRFAVEGLLRVVSRDNQRECNLRNPVLAILCRRASWLPPMVVILPHASGQVLGPHTNRIRFYSRECYSAIWRCHRIWPNTASIPESPWLRQSFTKAKIVFGRIWDIQVKEWIVCKANSQLL